MKSPTRLHTSSPALRVFLGLSHTGVMEMRVADNSRARGRAAALVWAAHTLLSMKTPIVMLSEVILVL